MLEFCTIHSFGKCSLNRPCFYLTFDSFDRLKNNNDENWYSTDIYKLEKTKEAGVSMHTGPEPSSTITSCPWSDLIVPVTVAGVTAGLLRIEVVLEILPRPKERTGL